MITKILDWISPQRVELRELRKQWDKEFRYKPKYTYEELLERAEKIYLNLKNDN